MELKTKYQYTYFIYPYIIKQKNLNRYFLSLLKNPSFEMKTFDKEKDEDLYSYFLPKVRNTMFWTMGLNRSKLTKFYDLDVATQATLLTEYPCTMFEYSLNEDIQGKAGKRDGIFFDITNITLVCFNTGICFMLMKTMLEGENSLANICNFNYKFRDIKSEAYDYRGYENIKIQTDRFNTIKEITDLITEITGENKEAAKMNIDTNRFITYSYACIGQEDWNDNTNIELLQKEFQISYPLSDPHIVQTIGFEEIPGIGSSIIMEYIDGIHLREYLNSKNYNSHVIQKILDEFC